MGTQRLFFSDVHMSVGQFQKDNGGYKYDWDWLSPAETDNFSRFLKYLNEVYVSKIREVVLCGDIFDTWMCPHDIAPPSIHDVIKANKNGAAIQELRKLSEKVPVFIMPGNHDMALSSSVVADYFPKMTFIKEKFIAGRLIAEHGHRYAMFNAPPFFSKNIGGLPLGYFLARIEATRTAKTSDNKRHYLSYLDDFLETIGPQTLPMSVLEAMLEESGLGEETEFKMKGPSQTVKASQVKEVYKNVFEDWPTATVSKTRAILAEMSRLGPIADKLCRHGAYKVCIFGHNHNPEMDKDTFACDDRIYANSGRWCNQNCTFIEVDKEKGEYTVTLQKWQNGEIHRVQQEKVK